MFRIALILLAALLSSGCTAPVIQKKELLTPRFWDLNSQPTVAYVAPESELSSRVTRGDRLVASNGKPVKTYTDLLTLMSAPDFETHRAQLVRADDSTYELTMQELQADETGLAPVVWVEFGSTAGVDNFTNIDGETQAQGLVYAGKLAASFAALRWDTSPPLIELSIVAKADAECEKCGIRDLRVLDLPRGSFVQAVPAEQAAWAVLPDLGNPEEMVPVPPPTPVGATASSHTTGSLTGHQYGGVLRGSYSGSTTTTIQPQYDYSAQNAAAFHNLAVATRNERIQNQNSARNMFLANRYGNLRLGQLEAGESVQGHLFFALPAGFDGPYAVQLVNETGEASWLVFEVPESPPK